MFTFPARITAQIWQRVASAYQSGYSQVLLSVYSPDTYPCTPPLFLGIHPSPCRCAATSPKSWPVSPASHAAKSLLIFRAALASVLLPRRSSFSTLQVFLFQSRGCLRKTSKTLAAATSGCSPSLMSQIRAACLRYVCSSLRNSSLLPAHGAWRYPSTQHFVSILNSRILAHP